MFRNSPQFGGGADTNLFAEGKFHFPPMLLRATLEAHHK